jgi:hypothetical protein
MMSACIAAVLRSASERSTNQAQMCKHTRVNLKDEAPPLNEKAHNYQRAQGYLINSS